MNRPDKRLRVIFGGLGLYPPTWRVYVVAGASKAHETSNDITRCGNTPGLFHWDALVWGVLCCDPVGAAINVCVTQRGPMQEIPDFRNTPVGTGGGPLDSHVTTGGKTRLHNCLARAPEPAKELTMSLNFGFCRVGSVFQEHVLPSRTPRAGYGDPHKSREVSVGCEILNGKVESGRLSEVMLCCDSGD